MANWTAEDFDFGDSSDTSNNEKYWRQKLGNQPVIKAPPPRSAWQRFVDSIDTTIRHYSPVAAGARAVQRSIPLDKAYNETFGGPTPAQRRKRLVQEERDWREIDAQRDPADSVGDYVADFGGSLVGSMISDPTNLINPGSSFGRQVAAQLGIGAVSDAALQGAEMGEGVRDEYDPVQGVISAAAGPVLMGTVKGAKLGVDKINSGRRINAGRRMENFNDLVDTVVRLEGGGTLANPKTSPKGAKGPMQVMDATARDPGFGIRPWNGKTEADRARVGRQYLAALNHKYNGDTAKVLAAYNGGPGRVDAAVKKYGADWLRAMPQESRQYVRNGLGRANDDVMTAEADILYNDPWHEFWGDDALPSLKDTWEQKKKEQEEKEIAEALMRKAEEDNSLTMQEQPENWQAEMTNDLLAPEDEDLPFMRAQITDMYGLNDEAAQKLIDSGHDLKSIKTPEAYTDAEWNKLPLIVKQASNGYAKYSDKTEAILKPKPAKYGVGKDYGVDEKYKTTPEEDDVYYGDEDHGQDFEEDDIDLDWEPEPDVYTKDGPDPHYEYFTWDQTPFGKYAADNGGYEYPHEEASAIYKLAHKYGVHEYDIAEAVINGESVKGLDVEKIKKEHAEEIENAKQAAYDEFYPPYTISKYYSNIDDYETKTGLKLGKLTKTAIQDMADLLGRHVDSVASHFLSDSGHSKLKEEVASYRDDLAKSLMTKKEYAAWQKFGTDKQNIAAVKILEKGGWIDKRTAQKVYKNKPPATGLRKTAETFLRMLKDDSGLLSPDPDRLHQAITEWDKGTNRLLKGEDGTPLRLYHGTNVPYEGLPSGEKNRRPKGFVLYATDPDFANAFAARGYGGREADQRLFPVYVRNNGRIADFRKPEDVEKAYLWHKNRSGSGWGTPSKSDLEGGNWSYWEEPEMMKANGWDGAFVTEGHYDKHGAALNLMIKDNLVYSVFDPEAYGNNTAAHRIVKTLKALLKDESGELRGDDHEKVVSLKEFKKSKIEAETKKRAQAIAEGVDIAREIHDAIKYQDPRFEPPTRDELHDAMENIEDVIDSWKFDKEVHDNLVDTHDLLRRAENMLYEDEFDSIVQPADREYLDSSHEKFTPYVDKPKKPANDRTEKRTLGRLLKDLWYDESGELRGDNEVDPVEQKLIDAYKEAIPVSAEQRALDRQAKAEKAGTVDKLQQEQLGEVGYYAQLGALKGELPKADFESLRDNFAQEDIDHLLNKINMAPKLMPLEKVKAQQAMAKLLGLGDANFSRAPTAGDIKLLAQVFSPKLVQALEDKGFWAKAGRHVISGLNLPRALMSSMDVSAPFRQGINFVGKSEFWRAIPHMLKLFGSEKLSKESLNEIYSRPTWELMKRAGLAIQDPHSHLLADREEPFQTDWAESKIAKAMLVGHGVAASNRAYHGFLNKLRADVFDNFVKQYETIGINLATDDKKLKEIARFINSATGRGDMGKHLNAAAPVLAQAFFSPRLIASRLYMLSPHIYAKKDPILRKEAWKALFSYGAVAIAVAGLAKYGLGMDVEDDPRSSDFMKPKIGNTRYDIMGGFQQYITFAAKFITNSKITAAGEEQEFDPDKPFGSTRGSETIKFARNKASPLNSLFWDWATGKDPVGNDFNWTDAAKSRLFPMGTQDMADAYNEWGGKGIAMAAPTLGGIGVQTYEPKKPKSKDQDSLDNDFDSGFSSDDFDFGDF